MERRGMAEGATLIARERGTQAAGFEEARARFAPTPRPEPGVTEDRRVSGETWVVILAGGEGQRLRPFTTREDGTAVPKQFCRFRDERSLLAATLDRALAVAPPERVLVMVMEAHRAWWERELERLPAGNVLPQPENRGTAVAILQSLVEIHCRDRNPRLVVMPSDADVDDEPVLLAAIEFARKLAGSYPRDIVLLGMTPSHIDCEYGLIVPSAARAGTTRRVRSFVEKPPLGVARRLTQQGAMWNSFIFACAGWALYELFEDALPSVARAYLSQLARGRGGDPRLRAVGEMPVRDFGHDVLERRTERLRLVAVPECGWTDLGTPARLASWLERHREAVFWREHRLPRLNGSFGEGGSMRAC